MSLGVNLLIGLAKRATEILSDAGFDIEIIEKHHNQKIDAPSGTALAIADGINDVLDHQYAYQYDRSKTREKRPKKEIGIHAIRGGTIVGDHDVLFAGQDEMITLSHTATSKEVFAVGAVKAANFHVLRETKAPAVLIEIGFIDNTKDNELFDTKFSEITEGITKAILDELGIKYIPLTRPVPESNDKTLYRVMAGSYAVRENAERQVDKLKKAGFDATLMIFNQ